MLSTKSSAHVKGRKVDYACLVSRDLKVQGQKQLHIWNPRPQFGFSLWHFYGAMMKNTGCLLMRLLTLRWNQAKIVSKSHPKMSNFGGFWSLGVRGYKKLRFLQQKAHLYVDPRRLRHSAWKLVWRYGLQVGSGKRSKESNIVYFTYLPRSPCWTDHHQICSGSWFPGRNQLCEISFQSVQRFWFCRGSNFGLSHRNEVSPLTQGLNYRAACDYYYYY